MTDTRERLVKIFQNVFDDDDLVLENTTTAEDIEEWNSLNNVKVMVRAEIEFGIEFKTSEVAELKDVGTLISLIESKRAQ